MKILVGGPQGSGKTTQAKLLSEYLMIPLIDGGDMLRKLAAQDSDEGRRVRFDLDNGLLAPDDIMGKLVKTRIAEEDCQNGFVMDGYPRSLDQLTIFDPKFDRVFYLDVTDDLVIDRLLKRGREDDTLALIKKRLSVYHQLTEPVLNHYDNLRLLHKIDGSGSIDEVQAKMREVINGAQE